MKIERFHFSPIGEALVRGWSEAEFHKRCEDHFYWSFASVKRRFSGEK
jgi:hypothetical protein